MRAAHGLASLVNWTLSSWNSQRSVLEIILFCSLTRIIYSMFHYYFFIFMWCYLTSFCCTARPIKLSFHFISNNEKVYFTAAVNKLQGVWMKLPPPMLWKAKYESYPSCEFGRANYSFACLIKSTSQTYFTFWNHIKYPWCKYRDGIYKFFTCITLFNLAHIIKNNSWIIVSI